MAKLNIGDRFGRWLVLGQESKLCPSGKRRRTYVLCRCDCGTEKLILPHGLTSGRTVSCGCYRRDDLERFQQKYRVDSGGCWLWTAAIDRHGYGQFRFDGKMGPVAHLFAYQFYKGPIPKGLTIDHTCHSNNAECDGGRRCIHRRCVNPDHLEAVTRGVNTLRGKTITAANLAKTTCLRGHSYDSIRRNGNRCCRTCHNELQRARNKRRAAAWS